MMDFVRFKTEKEAFFVGCDKNVPFLTVVMVEPNSNNSNNDSNIKTC